jgi:predicted nucleic acid-binding protein
VAVLDAAVLVRPGLRDLLLSCADRAAFRPVWQSELLNVLGRNATRLAVERGATQDEAQADTDHLLRKMAEAFPDAELDADLWVPLVPQMFNDPKDRHVLAAALGAGADVVVTVNLDDFPSRSWPAGVRVVHPDPFLSSLLRSSPEQVLTAVGDIAERNRRPPNAVRALAETYAASQFVPGFGALLTARLDNAS